MDEDELSDTARNLLYGFGENELAQMLADAQAALMKPARCPHCPHCTGA